MAVTTLVVWQLLATGPNTRILAFGQVDGLEVGDGVFLRGLRVGQVSNLQLEGSRVRVTIEIDAPHRDAIPTDAHFLLWRDPRDPRRRALRIQPGARPESHRGEVGGLPRRR